MVDMLGAGAGAESYRVIVGGGGTIAPHEIGCTPTAWSASIRPRGTDGRSASTDDGRRVAARSRRDPRTAAAFGPMGPRDHLPNHARCDLLALGGDALKRPVCATPRARPWGVWRDRRPSSASPGPAALAGRA